MRKPGSSGVRTLRNLRSAAIRLLSERGYPDMSLRLLAKSVGVQASALYNYIDSKQQLLFLLVKEPMDKLLAEVATVNRAQDPVEQMRAFVAINIRYYTRNTREHLILLRETRSLNAENHRAILKLERSYNRIVENIIERGIATGDFHVKDTKVTTIALVQMLNAMLNWYRPNGRLTPNELVEIYTHMAFGMLHLDNSDGRSSAFEQATALR